MELRRKALKQLEQWKTESQGRTALLIEGARRVGKSHLIRTFVQSAYRSAVIIDFSDIQPVVREIFENYSHDRSEFFSRLSIATGIELYPRESCIVFDEVQLYPKARQLVKHLVADGRFDILETGSLISLRANVKDIVIPSEEERIELLPLDLEEFADAVGKKMLFDAARTAFQSDKGLGVALHREMMKLVRLYMVVGGMPQAVSEYADTKNLLAVRRIQKTILELYRSDIARYAAGYESRVRELFDDVSAQLAKHDKIFRLSSLSKNARNRDYEDAFMWLADSKTVNLCLNSTDPSIGIQMNLDRTVLKCYMADTGLLLRQATDDGTELDMKTVNDVLYNRLSLNEGMFFENLVAQMLQVTGHRLFFYSQPRRGDDNGLEIDFLIRQAKKICPIEVKSSGYTAHASLDKFVKKYSSRLGRKFVIYGKDYRREDDVVYLPVYMTAFL